RADRAAALVGADRDVRHALPHAVAAGAELATIAAAAHRLGAPARGEALVIGSLRRFVAATLLQLAVRDRGDEPAAAGLLALRRRHAQQIGDRAGIAAQVPAYRARVLGRRARPQIVAARLVRARRAQAELARPLRDAAGDG